MEDNSNYTFSKVKDNRLSLDFHNYDYWESTDEILELLKSNFDAKLVKELDGPATRFKKVRIADEFFNLYYTSYGSFLSAENIEGDKILQKVKEQLDKLDNLKIRS